MSDILNNAPNKEIEVEFLDYIRQAFVASLPNTTQDVITTCEELFKAEYERNWKELLEKKREHNLSIRDDMLDKLEEVKVTCTAARQNVPEQIAKVLGERMQLEDEILLSRNLVPGANETTLKCLSAPSKSERDELRNRSVQVFKEIEHLKQMSKKLDTTIAQIEDENNELF